MEDTKIPPPAVKPSQNARHCERSEAIHRGFWISRRLAARNNTTVGAGFKPALPKTPACPNRAPAGARAGLKPAPTRNIPPP
ncbi:MAG: hypothetical protein LBG78_02645, partial [Azoarcus sp.]|nr:hypothetical protein [Azoarcus sp.]